MKTKTCLICLLFIFDGCLTSCNKCKNHVGSEDYVIYNNTDSILKISQHKDADSWVILKPNAAFNIKNVYENTDIIIVLPSGKTISDKLFNGDLEDSLSLFNSKTKQNYSVNDRGCLFNDKEYVYTINNRNLEK